MPLVRDLLDLPTTVSKTDYVQSLARSLNEPDKTVATYAVTPALVQNFREALQKVRGALESGRSRPSFLNGSFGSGKSHFMAMLHIMLSGSTAPWRRPELHPLREEYARIEGKKLLQLHFHMLSSNTTEHTLFAGYVEYVQAHHPDASLPALFRDQAIFDNARSLRATLGDDAFFAALNKGKAKVSGFGKRGGGTTWTAERFEATLESSDPDTRAKLFSDLAKTLLPSAVRQTERFVGIDEGLGALTRHAAGLGYDAVVLYLDELILWLASRSADMAFVQREINKLVKLLEAQDESRDIPVVAFIARQRDLSELMGDAGTGAERRMIEETFDHHKSRFDEINLADSNLRAIIPHRVVKARTPADRVTLEEGFADMWRTVRSSAAALQGGDATEADFRQVYPFSPALIDVLIGLSDQLQRDRTAIRILVELLVEHLTDLKLGEVVPVGDVYDLVASAEDTVDGPSRARFQRARDLYRHELLPGIQASHGTNTPGSCQRLRDGHPVRLGCSACPQRECRATNRLVKTVLLSALVPNARPFRGLSVKRLVDLNHGSIRAPMDKMKVNRAATRLRGLIHEVPAIRIGNEADPLVSISLQSVDIKPLLRRADDQDTRARRRNLLRKLLFEQIGVSTTHSRAQHPVELHHVRRTGAVTFANVRELRPDELQASDGAEWHVVIDYPFDADGFTPEDDERAIARARDILPADTPTAIWLPTFFSERIQRDLGDLARLTHILAPENLTGFLAEVPPDDHQLARVDLESLRDRKLYELRQAMKKAYGLLRPSPGDPHVDLDRAVNQHLHALHENHDASGIHAPDLSTGLDRIARDILQAKYPRHPIFKAVPSYQRITRVKDLLIQMMESPGGIMEASKGERGELAAIAEPLGLCRVHSQTAELLTRRFDHIEGQCEQANVEAPSLRQVTAWIDEPGWEGLSEETVNLIAWLWAARARRVAVVGSTPQEWPRNARLSPHTVFETPDLPGESDWTTALERAAIFGVVQSGKALNARSLAALTKSLRSHASGPAALAAARTPALLKTRRESLALSVPSPRAHTAEVLVELTESLQSGGGRTLVEAFAGVSIDGTSIQALSKARAAAAEVVRALDGESSWTVLAMLTRHRLHATYGAEVTAVLDEVGRLLIEDELTLPLSNRLRELMSQASRLLKQIQKPPPPPGGKWSERWNQGVQASTYAEALAAVDALRERLQQASAEGGPGAMRFELSGRLLVQKTTER